MQIPFLGPTYRSRSGAVACDRSVNFFPELNQADSKSIISIHGTPGTRLFATPGATPVRGTHVFYGAMFCVVGNKLFSVSTAGVTSAVLGTLNTSTGFVVMANNGLASAGIGGNQLAIVDGVNLYIYNVVTGVFSVASGGGLPANPTYIAYIDGYFVVIDGSMSYWVSDLYDGLTWNALATSPVGAVPDNIVAVVNFHQQLWFIKDYSSEVWYNAGTPTSLGSPFLRISGAVTNYGTIAPASVSQGANSLFFLGYERNNDGGEMVGVVQMNGYTPVMISTPAINYRISQLTCPVGGPTDAIGYCYIEEGHEYYVLTFPTGNATIVYDVTTQMWHERSTAVPLTAISFSLDDGISLPPLIPVVNTVTVDLYTVNRHFGNCYAFFNNKHYVGRFNSGSIYEMSANYDDDDGLPIVSMRIAQHVWDKQGLGNVMFHKLQIDAEAGVGNVAQALSWGQGQLADGSYEASGVIYAGSDIVLGGTDPKAILSWSDDGGHTWSRDRSAQMGMAGDYKRRMIWRRLGYTKNSRVFRLAIFDSVKKNIVGAYLEATG